MGRRKNNPALVKELIDGLKTMDDDEFEVKYNSLSSTDMSRVGMAIDHMNDDEDDMPPGCLACGGDYPACIYDCQRKYF